MLITRLTIEKTRPDTKGSSSRKISYHVDDPHANYVRIITL